MVVRGLLLAIACAAQGARGWVQIPGGRLVEQDCILQIPNGAVVNVDEELATKLRAGCSVKDKQVSEPQLQIYAADAHWQSQEPIKNFTADWVVPPLPSRADGQVVYFWPGLKSVRPEMGYPVIQPVMQFGERSGGWELQSWFVDARSVWYPVVTAPPIKVNPGDKITSYISLSHDGQTWTISGRDVTTGQDSTLNIKYSRAGKCDYHFAMLVNENINITTICDLMPAADSVTFTGVEVDGQRPSWTTRANCAGNPQCDCGNQATVDDASGDVTLSWKTKASGTEVVV
eukprot:CAMPEP_0177351498 /NCGR_PEP_ID=MMETSP0368-20130122/31866_1 /TAXON_ID=447022 ORGANISM="Scrippsiella hangoei-like, Strain SHHI-4" /NCGR_SAMPLE_ID=MMETSP0368 /ASSEMBLY_ACC=CAM_ASM_000363 /LENGTH=287 /DNA_ID=CAMNT_0018813451 /DNA_START=65 /DNA_END=928 /DNA_ORIENTATION=-